MTERDTMNRIQDLLDERVNLLVKIELNKFDRKEYHVWRKKLIDLQNELERLQS
jgi:hypothetical protein